MKKSILSLLMLVGTQISPYVRNPNETKLKYKLFYIIPKKIYVDALF